MIRVKESNGSRHTLTFADTPNSGGVVVRKTGSRTGNKRHDSRSGKFTRGGGKGKQQPKNANIDPGEIERMLSAARDAAREFDVFAEGDVEEFLKGRAKDASVVDVEAFLGLVRRQRLTDLADLLDQQLRAAAKGGKKKVRLTASKGFTAKAINDLSTEEISIVMSSLLSRGHSEEDAKKFFQDKDLGEVQFSNMVEEEGEPSEMVQLTNAIRSQPSSSDITAAFVNAIEKMPVPEIIVNIPEPKPRALKLKRGSNGLLESVEETDAA